jgi:urease accessory protein
MPGMKGEVIPIVGPIVGRLSFLAAVIPAAAAGMVPNPSYAHTGSVTGGYLGGLIHPVLGPDHVLAMVAVGLWGAVLGAPALYMLPIAFPLMMAVGGVLGIAAIAVPGSEVGIALSAVVLGLMVMLAARPPFWVAALVVAAFAIFHGYAHGAEIPPGTDAVAYSAGFVVATGLLHLAGIGLGLLSSWPIGAMAVRGAGAIIAGAGFFFLLRLA